MQKYNGALLRKFDDPIEGNASVGTSVVVRKKSDNSLAPIYNVDDVNSIQKPNPFTTDAFGRYSFFAPNGKYILQFGDGSDEIEVSMVDNLDHNELNHRNAAGAHDTIYRRVFDSVVSMTAYSDHHIGNEYTTGGTSWKVTNNSINGVFLTTGKYATPISEIYVDDFGLKGDGATNNDATFVAMLDKVKGEFIFSNGVYGFENAYIDTLKDLTFKCINGASVKRLSGTYGTNKDGAISGFWDFVNCENIKLVEVVADCNKSGAIPSGGTHLNGVNFYKCNSISTVYSDFKNAEFQALNHQNCNDVRVFSNDFSDCGWSGVGVTGGYFSEYGAERAWVSNNTFVNVWAGVQSQVSMRYLYIEDNIFKNSSIIIAQDVVYGHIKNNEIYGAAPNGALGEVPQDGIFIESSSVLHVKGNIINNTARHGILVTGNYIDNGPREGVLVCDRVVVENNYISNCPQGGISFNAGSQYTYNYSTHTATLEADEALWTQATLCSVNNNMIESTGGIGLQIGIIKNSKVYKNSISLNQLSGVEIGNCRKLTLAQNQVFNNSQVAADLHDGVRVKQSSALVDYLYLIDNVIYDNQSSRTQAYGINNQNIACTNFKMQNNQLDRNGTDFICVVDYTPFLTIQPTLLNGSTAFGSGFQSPSYYRDGDGIVHLRGMVQLGGSSVGTVLFTLQNNYKPKADEMFVTISNQQLARVDTKSNGDVVVSLGQNSQWISLSGISFATGI